MSLELNGYDIKGTTSAEMLRQDRLVLPGEITRETILLSNALISLLQVPFKGNQKTRLLAAINNVETLCSNLKILLGDKDETIGT